MGKWRRKNYLFLVERFLWGKGGSVFLYFITELFIIIKACLKKSYVFCWLFYLHIKIALPKQVSPTSILINSLPWNTTDNSPTERVSKAFCSTSIFPHLCKWRPKEKRCWDKVMGPSKSFKWYQNAEILTFLWEFPSLNSLHRTNVPASPGQGERRRAQWRYFWEN